MNNFHLTDMNPFKPDGFKYGSNVRIKKHFSYLSRKIETKFTDHYG